MIIESEKVLTIAYIARAKKLVFPPYIIPGTFLNYELKKKFRRLEGDVILY